MNEPTDPRPGDNDDVAAVERALRAVRLRRIALLAAMVAATTACGGGSGGGGGPLPSAPAPAPTPAPTPPASSPGTEAPAPSPSASSPETEAPAPAPSASSPETEAPAPAPPASSPEPEAPAPPPSAQACFNGALQSRAGMVASLTYDVVQGGVAKKATYTGTVEGAATFDGQAATRLSVSETIQVTGQPDVLFTGTHYLRVADSAVKLLGTVSEFDQAGATVTQTLTVSPAAPDLDFALTVGASTTVDATTRVTFTPAGTAASSFPTTVKLSFAGFETVTVPAGTFANACKFVQEVTTSGTQTTTRWIAQTSGVMVRSVTGADTQELAAGTVDGVAVAGSAGATAAAAKARATGTAGKPTR